MTSDVDPDGSALQMLIRIQRYKMKGKAEFNQIFFVGNYIFEPKK